MGLMIKGTIPRVPPFNPPYRMVTVFFLQRTEIRADFGHPNLQYLRKPSHVNKKLPETAFPQKMGYPWTEGNFVKKMFCVLFFRKKTTQFLVAFFQLQVLYWNCQVGLQEIFLPSIRFFDSQKHLDSWECHCYQSGATPSRNKGLIDGY